MNLAEFLKKVEKIDSKIEKITDENNSIAIKDGVVDSNKYINSKYKIAWILKEVNSEEDGGGWNLREAIRNLKTEKGIRKGWEKTFAPIVYATYGIVNSKFWEESPHHRDVPEMIDVLQQIVYLNIKKTAGVSVANHDELQSSYQTNKNIFLEQLELYNPDVIICGNTFKYIKDDLNLTDYQTIKYPNSNLCVYFNDDKIYLDAYHPCARIKKQFYVDDIINAVLTWKNR